jgi:3',5'-cyclic AMP phosphodiesterase CpdA
MPITILHLTDIHTGKYAISNVDNKANLPVKTRSALETLSGYIGALERVPDFVVVSGDITVRGDPTGLAQFREWLETEIRNKKLPEHGRIILTPGNHDITRPSAAEESTVDKRFDAFWEAFATGFPHAHIAERDPKPKFGPGKLCKQGQTLFGGIEAETRAGRTSLLTSLPFLLDLKTNVLIFAFNSSLGCGMRLPASEQIMRPLESLMHIGALTLHKADLEKVVKHYRDSLVIDAGLIGDSQLKDFQLLMNGLRKELGTARYDRLTKIACLHHHVSNLWQQQLELKSFETILDAAQTKQALIENGFDFVLHGHKHTNHVGIDGALIPLSDKTPFSPLCVVSGGTVGGATVNGQNQSFKLLVLGDAVPRQGATIIETELQETANYAAAALRYAKVYAAPVGQRLPQLHDFEAVKDALDRALQAKLTPELPSQRPEMVALKPARRGLISPELQYKCACLKKGSGTTLFEFLLLTKKLGFGNLARIHWLLTDASAPGGGKKRSQVVLTIGNLDGTHFFQGQRSGEIAASIEELKGSFAPAIKSGLLAIRVHKFRQTEIDGLTQRTSKVPA